MLMSYYCKQKIKVDMCWIKGFLSLRSYVLGPWMVTLSTTPLKKKKHIYRVLNGVYNFVRVCPDYKRGIASRIDIICLVRFVCTPSIQCSHKWLTRQRAFCLSHKVWGFVLNCSMYVWNFFVLKRVRFSNRERICVSNLYPNIGRVPPPPPPHPHTSG